ncbi:hypothetical protein L7F22_029270 [Adiantum nelumboides]|nr:hypothetical protein [Adiantum nelumboides]
MYHTSFARGVFNGKGVGFVLCRPRRVCSSAPLFLHQTCFASMPRWGKGRAKDDFIDDGSDEEKPARKAAKKDSDDSEGIVVCELSGNRKVTVRSFKGKVYIDIREFYTKDGKDLPGKKGISLPLEQWEVLRDNVDAIDKAVKESD